MYKELNKYNEIINEYLKIIDKYDLILKIKGIATKIRKLQETLTSKDLHYIDILTKQIRQNTNFEGVPYKEKVTKIVKLLFVFQKHIYIIIQH